MGNCEIKSKTFLSFNVCHQCCWWYHKNGWLPNGRFAVCITAYAFSIPLCERTFSTKACRPAPQDVFKTCRLHAKSYKYWILWDCYETCFFLKIQLFSIQAVWCLLCNIKFDKDVIYSRERFLPMHLKFKHLLRLILKSVRIESMPEKCRKLKKKLRNHDIRAVTKETSKLT